MREKINEEVSVLWFYDAIRRKEVPYMMWWHGRRYELGKIGYHHSVWDGRTLHHIYELVDKEETI